MLRGIILVICLQVACLICGVIVLFISSPVHFTILVCMFDHSFDHAYMFVYLCDCLLVGMFICLFNSLFVCLFIRLFTLLLGVFACLLNE